MVSDGQVKELRRLLFSGKSNNFKAPDPLLSSALVPNIVKRTPPYIDRVATGSAGDRAGLQADDLIIELDGVMTSTALEFMEQLQTIDRDQSATITVQRGNQFLERELRVTK